jgi:ABC-type transport system substrate-binding protein
MAESWEVSPDKLTVTMKLRKGAGTKWDERAPTNGREMTMDDVLYSYRKFAEINPSGANVANARNPASPVLSVEASDDSTLVIKLSKPDATIIPLFSATDHLYIMPTEADGQFNPETEVRGNGPWQLQEYVPSSRFVWKKNPNYYVDNRPFPDLLERPIVTELSQQLAQFRAGNIHTDIVANAQQEVVQLKQDVPEANLVLPRTYPNSLTPSIWFGYEGNSPFKDQRVRQAASMLIDREAFNAVIYNADQFDAAGLSTEARFNTCVTAGWGPYWLDPKSSDFGENAKYLQFNFEEATKLLEAAGLGNGVETEVHFNSELTYGPTYQQAVEVYAGFLDAAGIRSTFLGVPYTEYLNQYYFGYRGGASTRGGGGDAQGYNGWTVQAERPYPTAVNLMLGSWHSAGGAFHGMSPNGEDAFAGDPDVDALIEKIQGEFELDSQIALSHDLIRYITGMAYMVPRPVVSPPYQVFHPAISGVGWRERWPNNALWAEEAIDWWIDSSKL